MKTASIAGLTVALLASSALAQVKTPAVNVDQGTTVSGLVTCNSGTRGSIAYVTDALLPAALAAVTGGGAVVVPVFCNGTAWIVM